MGTKIVDVRTRLRLDDLASRTLDSIRKGFADTDKERTHTQSGFTEFARSVAGWSIGSMLQPAIMKVREYAHAFIDAQEQAEKTQQIIGALVAANNNLDAKQSLKAADEYMENLDESALKTRQSIASVREAFGVLLELQGGATKNIPEAEVNLERMANVAGKLGMDVAAVAREFGMMEEGVLRTKGHLFQVLQSTGVFGKNTKQAGEYWSKLTEPSRHQLLNYALEKMGKKLEDFPPTLGGLVTQLDDLWTIVKEKLGQPLVAALMPELQDLVKELMGGRTEMGKFATGLGKEVGAWVKDAAKSVREGFQYLKDHQAEIAADIKAAFTNAREVVGWILQHKEEIAVAFGAKMAMPALSAGAQGVGALANLGAKGSSAIGMAGTGGGLLAGGAVVIAFAAAVAAWVLAIDQWKKLMAITDGGKSDARMSQDARKQRFEQMAAAPEVGASSADSIKRFEALRKSYVEQAKALGDDSRAAGELADKAWEAHRAVRSKVEVFDRMKDAFKRLEATGGSGQGADFGKAVDLIDKGFGDASTAHNAGMQKYIADVLGGSTTLQKAFLSSSAMSADGFLALADLLKDSSKDFAEKLRALAAKEGGGEKAKAPVAVFTGPITIKQDYRQVDPDRVAVAFRRDMGKQAEVRLQSGWTSPFGT